MSSCDDSMSLMVLGARDSHLNDENITVYVRSYLRGYANQPELSY